MKHIYNIIYCLSFIAGFASCVTEDLVSDCPNNGQTAEKAQVMLNLSIPNDRLPHSTRAINDDSEINSLYVLEFESGILKKKIDITSKYKNASDSENGRKLYVAIEETENPVQLSIIANYDISNLIEESTTLAEAKRLGFKNSNDAIYIPMYGEAEEFSNGLSRNNSYNVSVELVRSFAKIEVQYNSTQTVNEFELLDVEVVNVNTAGHIVEGNEIPEGQTTDITIVPTKVSQSPNRREVATFYIGETNNNASNKISVILRGKYYGAIGYYRLDMIKYESEEVINVLKRNYRYILNVQNVNYAGRASKEEALQGDADNKAFKATVMTLTAAEGDILDITTDDQYFLGVNSSTLQLTDNGNICFAKLKVLTNNTDEGWIIADYPSTGVTFSPSISGGKGARVVNTVWIYIDTKIIKSDFNFYVKTGKIRKTILVKLP